MDDVVYLDYNGSAPLDPRVSAVIGEVAESFGNAAAVHIHGRMQALRLDDAREHVAELTGFRPGDVIFTAGATEANNLALKGLTGSLESDRKRILISAVEHASVTETAKWLHATGQASVEAIPVGPGGSINLDALDELLTEPVGLVSVMAANSETGVLNPIETISERVHASGAVLHCDATQLLGRLPTVTGPDLLSMSSHKICGPGGVGALVATRNIRNRINPVIHGGGHEEGLRSGSPNVVGVVGFGEAARLATTDGVEDMARVKPWRDQLAERLTSQLPDSYQIGDTSYRLPNTLSIRFPDTDAQAIMINAPDVSMSTGSACSAGAIEPSAVLTAMGVGRDEAFEVLRLSLGRFTTAEDINTAAESIVRAVQYVRSVTQQERTDATI